MTLRPGGVRPSGAVRYAKCAEIRACSTEDLAAPAEPGDARPFLTSAVVGFGAEPAGGRGRGGGRGPVGVGLLAVALGGGMVAADGAGETLLPVAGQLGQSSSRGGRDRW